MHALFCRASAGNGFGIAFGEGIFTKKKTSPLVPTGTPRPASSVQKYPGGEFAHAKRGQSPRPGPTPRPTGDRS